MSEAVEPSEWQPDWLSELVNRSTRSAILSTPFTSDQTEGHLPAPSEQQNDPISSGNSANASQPPLADSESTHIFDYREETRLPVTPSGERSVRRTLKGIHLFVRIEILYHNAPRSSNQMITVNATLGTGLYWRGGQILELGGPLAVLVSFLVVGLLSWAVMQCITEMLCIWPIPGALSVYVSQFVDEELGITVGITYWFTYSMSFSTLVATSAAEFNFWRGINDSRTIQGVVIYFLIPLILVLLNTMRIQIYGWLEVATGSLKIFFLIFIIIALIAINLGAGSKESLHYGAENWGSPTDFDRDAADNWVISLLMSISIATFAYVGVEVVSSSVLEAKSPNLSKGGGNPFKFSAIYIPVFATVAYCLSGVLGTLDIAWNHPHLPRLSWLPPDLNKDDKSPSRAAFVVIALASNIPGLDDTFNAFLVFTCLSCAATNLYVASRTLFGLTSRLEGGEGRRWYLRVLASFGKTDGRQVPLRAMIFSAVAFWWFVEVLSEMASVSVLHVWACECLAFIRFYRCIYQHREYLERENIALVQRWSVKNYSDYPYRSYGQPLLAYLALSGCIFVLLVANGAALWNGFHLLPFLASYLTVIVFIGIWILLKIFRSAPWSFVDLSQPKRVAEIFRHLHDIRLGGTDSTEDISEG
ncbi:hypothetical protein PENARI_c015G08367 [Penicillium arizonense]|uniref:Amino acid permease/ SLC12A domain-containing protein n=1 Tax=Penicillium arizonense TaxID=1835702 RepID=A0A1F5LDD3_PENAI|nr:hypothetical protein PENARI_c015G08367 [Penicillium arizonense]OGE50939.1 hypothetical protein PENARI_c015G08367 [Penicillium arizonense]